MDFKEIPIGSRQDNTKTLSEIEADLKKSLAAWEPLLNVVYDALLKDDLELVRAIQIPIEKALKMIKRADKYRPIEETVLCSHCSEPALVEECVTGISSLGRGETCVLCHSWVCHNCVDWKCMVETGTDQIVCKECSKLFENCKGDN